MKTLAIAFGHADTNSSERQQILHMCAETGYKKKDIVSLFAVIKSQPVDLLGDLEIMSFLDILVHSLDCQEKDPNYLSSKFDNDYQEFCNYCKIAILQITSEARGFARSHIQELIPLAHFITVKQDPETDQFPMLLHNLLSAGMINLTTGIINLSPNCLEHLNKVLAHKGDSYFQNLDFSSAFNE